MKPFLSLLILLTIFLIASCTPLNEQRVTLLSKARFNPVDVKTHEQQRQFDDLPRGKITEVTYNGKSFFLYPDTEIKQLYIGTDRDYKEYKKLLSHQFMSTLKMHESIEHIKKEDSTWGSLKGWDKGPGWD